MVAPKATRGALVALQTLMGFAAVGGGAGLIFTNGLGMPLEWLEGSPFASYTIPGLVLLAVGSANLAGAVGVLRRHWWGAQVSLAAGMMWVGWFVVQVAVVGFVSWQQPVYFAAGLAIIALAAVLLYPGRRTGVARAGGEGDRTGRRVRSGSGPGEG